MDVHVGSTRNRLRRQRGKVWVWVVILNDQIDYKRLWKPGKRIRISRPQIGFDGSLLRHVHRLPSREITRAELALAHTGEHIRNYFAPPPWHQTSSKTIIRLPSPPPSSTGSTTTTTLASAMTTPPASGPATESDEPTRSEHEKQVTFADSPVKVEYEQEFPPFRTPTGPSFGDNLGESPHKRRASGLDMDLMTAVAAKEDSVEVKPSVWPETLTHMMGCGELAIGNTHIRWG